MHLIALCASRKAQQSSKGDSLHRVALFGLPNRVNWLIPESRKAAQVATRIPLDTNKNELIRLKFYLHRIRTAKCQNTANSLRHELLIECSCLGSGEHRPYLITLYRYGDQRGG